MDRRSGRTSSNGGKEVLVQELELVKVLRQEKLELYLMKQKNINLMKTN